MEIVDSGETLEDYIKNPPSEYAKERKEHPSLPAKAIRQIVKDHARNPFTPKGRLFWSSEKEKLAKTRTISFDITPIESCPRRGLCASYCFGMRGFFRMTDHWAKYVENKRLSKDPRFVEWAVADINSILTRGIPLPDRLKVPRSIRIHGIGDFYSQEYLDKWVRIVSHFPKVQFYAYTKSHAALDFSKMPKNFLMVKSYGGKDDAHIDPARDYHALLFVGKTIRGGKGYTKKASRAKMQKSAIARMAEVNKSRRSRKLPPYVYGSGIDLPALRGLGKVVPRHIGLIPLMIGAAQNLECGWYSTEKGKAFWEGRKMKNPFGSGYDDLSIGPTPSDEDCAQVGDDNYARKAKRECLRFINLLRRKFGPEPAGARLIIKGNPHDFGTYYEVNVRFEEGNSAAIAYALKLESNTPETWEGEPEVNPPEDPTEDIRREMVRDINIVPGSREDLESKYGRVWSTEEVRAEFEVLGFMAPFVIVTRKADGVKGSLMFQHDPRFYFSFTADNPLLREEASGLIAGGKGILRQGLAEPRGSLERMRGIAYAAGTLGAVASVPSPREERAEALVGLEAIGQLTAEELRTSRTSRPAESIFGPPFSRNPGDCPVCGGPGWGAGEICMDCVRARHRGAVTHRCSCGRKCQPKAMQSRSRKWQSCERCLAPIAGSQENPCDHHRNGGKSICTCGHTGDGYGSQHEDSAYGLGAGHGKCKMCECQKFTWKDFAPGFDPSKYMKAKDAGLSDQDAMLAATGQQQPEKRGPSDLPPTKTIRIRLSDIASREEELGPREGYCPACNLPMRMYKSDDPKKTPLCGNRRCVFFKKSMAELKGPSYRELEKKPEVVKLAHEYGYNRFFALPENIIEYAATKANLAKWEKRKRKTKADMVMIITWKQMLVNFEAVKKAAQVLGLPNPPEADYDFIAGEGGAHIIHKPEHIDAFRLATLRGALFMEALHPGMRMKRGMSAQSIVKKEMKWKGNAISLFRQLTAYMKERGLLRPDERLTEMFERRMKERGNPPRGAGKNPHGKLTLIGRKVTRIVTTKGTIKGRFGGLYGLKDGSVFVKCFAAPNPPVGSVKVIEYLDEAKAKREKLNDPSLPWRHDFTTAGVVVSSCRGGFLFRSPKPLWGMR